MSGWLSGRTTWLLPRRCVVLSTLASLHLLVSKMRAGVASPWGCLLPTAVTECDLSPRLHTSAARDDSSEQPSGSSLVPTHTQPHAAPEPPGLCDNRLARFPRPQHMPSTLSSEIPQWEW